MAERVPPSHKVEIQRHISFAGTMLLSLGYGYGFLAVFVISSFSLAGAVVFPLTKRPFYKYFNAFFTSLAVGALFSNSTFELLPAVCFDSRKSFLLSHHHSFV